MKQRGKTSLAETRAIITIACILILAISLPAILDRVFYRDDAPAPSLEAITIVNAHDEVQETAQNNSSHQKSWNTSNQKHFSRDNNKRVQRSFEKTKFDAQIKCQSFDPNSVTKEALVSMGVSSYVAGNLVKFRESGAVFRRNEDVLKIYGVDSTIYQALASCITLRTYITATNEKKPKTRLDINSAGIEEWKQLPGIGDVLAARIVKYRDGLGGFYSTRQVSETYGLPPETYASIADELVMATPPKTIDINTASLEDLAAHPYISQKQAETIVNYRTHHGNFTKLQEMMKIYSLQREWLERMQPYLTCEQCKVAADMVDAIE